MSKNDLTRRMQAVLPTIYAGREPPWTLYSEVKSGPSWGQGGRRLLIMDAVAIKNSWSRPCIEAFELKATRADFLRDRKWPQYKAYCHKLSFVCPPGVVTLKDLDGPERSDVGLLYYSAEHDSVWVKRRALHRKIDLRSAEVVSMLLYLAYYRAATGGERRAQ